jgi:hypothetical protein
LLPQKSKICCRNFALASFLAKKLGAFDMVFHAEEGPATNLATKPVLPLALTSLKE